MDESAIAAAMGALYLRGAPRGYSVPNNRWPGVLRALRASSTEPATALRAAGFWLEAATIEAPGLMAWSFERIDSGEVITVVDAAYPARWLSTLGARAPAALWIRGDRDLLSTRRWVSVVGSRDVPSSVRAFSRSVGERSVALGFGVVSGRAEGCDTAAASGALLTGGSVVEVLPYGLSLARGRRRGLWLSVCAPDEAFSRGTAMERNALVYAVGEAAVVCHVRFKEGGTWHGATDALRRHLTRLVVRDDGTPASRALIGLGAVPVRSAGELGMVLSEPEIERGLFAIG